MSESETNRMMTGTNGGAESHWDLITRIFEEALGVRPLTDRNSSLNDALDKMTSSTRLRGYSTRMKGRVNSLPNWTH